MMLKEYLHTWIQTLKYPRQVIDRAIRPETSGYQHPFLFNVMGAAGVTLILILLPLPFLDNVVAERTGGESIAIDLQHWILDVKSEAATRFLPLSIFLLLIISLSIPGLFFFRDKLEGFYSNLVMNSMAVGAAIPFTLLMVPFWMLSGRSATDPLISSYLPGVIFGSIIIWVYWGYMNSSKGGPELVIRILSSYILGFFIFLTLRDFSASILGYFLFAVERLIELWGEQAG